MNKTIAELIKEARKKAGLTQKDIADHLGVSYQAYSQYERGLRIPKLNTLNRIASAIGCDILDLIPFDDSDIDLDGLLFAGNDPETMELLQDLREAEQNNNDPSIRAALALLQRRNSPELNDTLKEKLCSIYDALNLQGREKLVEYAEDLATIAKYKK